MRVANLTFFFSFLNVHFTVSAQNRCTPLGLFVDLSMFPTHTETLDPRSSDASTATFETMESITSAPTFELFGDLNVSIDSAGDPVLPALPSLAK